MSSKDVLVKALTDANAPVAMIVRAQRGDFSDYDSDSATPITDLVNECRRFGLESVAKQAMNGDFDATAEESDAWWEREGRSICPPSMRDMFERKKPQ